MFEKMFRPNGKTADAYEEMRRNGSALKRVNKLYNIISIVYAAICIPYAAASVFLIFLSVSDGQFSTLIDGVILKGGLLFFGYMSCYKHRNFFAGIAVAFQLFNVFCSFITYFDSFFGIVGMNLNDIILSIVVILAVLTMINNAKYRFLEAQTGFPYFSQRIEEQKFDRRQFDIKNEYEQKLERLAKTMREDMEDFDEISPSSDTGSQDSPQSRKMDEI